jgi:hypothetical protein
MVNVGERVIKGLSPKGTVKGLSPKGTVKGLSPKGTVPLWSRQTFLFFQRAAMMA